MMVNGLGINAVNCIKWHCFVYMQNIFSIKGISVEISNHFAEVAKLWSYSLLNTIEG